MFGSGQELFRRPQAHVAERPPENVIGAGPQQDRACLEQIRSHPGVLAPLARKEDGERHQSGRRHGPPEGVHQSAYIGPIYVSVRDQPQLVAER